LTPEYSTGLIQQSIEISETKETLKSVFVQQNTQSVSTDNGVGVLWVDDVIIASQQLDYGK